MTSKEMDFHQASYSETLKVLLNQEGFRFTNQRQKILAAIEGAAEGDHLSAEEIYQRLSEDGENIGFSTIYRALHIMVDLGVLRELGLAEGKRYYELKTPFINQHHHLVCIQCGAVQEFEDDRITQTGFKEADNHGFSMLNCQFSLLAICPDCQRG